MNRYAVALAADSAVTTTYWQGGKRQTRYFKGANKIFSASNRYPVGLMIYDAAGLQGVPWEIIVKAYRSQRGDTPQNDLKDYAKDLFKFIASNKELFPREHQDKHLISSIVEAMSRLTFAVANKPEGRDAIVAAFEVAKAAIEGDAFIDGFDCAAAIKAAAKHKDEVLKASAGDGDFVKAKEFIDADQLFELATASVFKREWTTLETTGVVFAGYGENQYFPELLHHQCYGVIQGSLLCEPVQNRSRIGIGVDNSSAIEPLAQSDMVKTFIYGASPSALNEIGNLVNEALSSFENSLVEKGHLQKGTDFAELRNQASVEFGKKSTSYLFSSHTRPLRQVVGMLSVPEMAELAETLIAIESLKERVTKPTESVSGPVDVAVISKGDGFIWIKRKHYFEADLNPRFFARQVQAQGESHEREDTLRKSRRSKSSARE